MLDSWHIDLTLLISAGHKGVQMYDLNLTTLLQESFPTIDKM
jgi:hypothetical protein